MQLIPVKSSNLKAAGHDNGIMRVQFPNGTEYDYKGVSAEVFNNMLQSKSVGKFFHTNIKSKFIGAKVVKEDENG